MANYNMSPMPAADIDSAKKTLGDIIAAMEPYKMVLNNEERLGARSMAEGREGYARLISQVALVNENSLPREHSAADLAAKLAYDSRLEELRQLLLKLSELITETQMANSVNIMRLVDVFSGSLQVSRKGNTALDMAMNEVDDWNRRFVNKDKATPEAPDPSAPQS